ncbi:MAG: alanine--tRNA ligase [Bradymonadia bacterium]
MNSKDLRKKFLSFFASHEHEVVKSSDVVPKNDPTLLFTNAGMNQFKDVFLGNDVRAYKRATSCQKCIRAGGKHNDLDEVGRDGRHLTFFEMLGSWSFGDYGKRDAIVWAWDFVTQKLGLQKETLYISIYKDDDESFEHWHKVVGLPAERIQRFGDIDKGDEENFWSMGPVGPCGPCTEIYIDLEPEKPGSWGVGFDENRYLELWNIVFMTSERDEKGNLHDLPMCSVDTGMGLERIACILQGADNVYETDIFKAILEATARELGKNLSQAQILASPELTAYRVIADHIRTLTFAISEGQPFANDGRGYVLRRILRRAVRFGRTLGFEGPFLHRISQTVVDEFGGIYPEIVMVAKQCQEVLRIEEERFFKTLDRGIARFEDIADRSKNSMITGKDAFVLYDTFGFPFDLTQIMAKERGMQVDEQGFLDALQEQRMRSAESAKFYVSSKEPWIILHEGENSEFSGYHRHELRSQVLRYRVVDDVCEVVLRRTPFYAEGGGEIGDRGSLNSADASLKLAVYDTQKIDGAIVHRAHTQEGFITTGVMALDFDAIVDRKFRAAVAANHTATHLLQAALQEVISKKIHQAGSLVREDRFRFDFTFDRGLKREEIRALERYINDKIQAAIDVEKLENIPIEDAKAMGAMAIFGEKYGDFVRVVRIADTSTELCGGIHVDNTSEIGSIRIVAESAIAAGVRRIEAATRYHALAIYNEEHHVIEQIADTLSCDDRSMLLNKIQKLNERSSEVQKENERLKLKLAQSELSAILASRQMRGDIAVYAAKVEVSERKQLLTYADLLRDKIGKNKGIALLGAIIDAKPALIALVSDACIPAYHAGKLVGACAQIIDGKGGGRPNTAQAGGNDASKLDEAINAIFDMVQ